MRALQEESDIKHILARNIRRIRRAKGFSQAYLSELTGINPNHLSQIETYRLAPSIATLAKLVKALQILCTSDLFEDPYPEFSLPKIKPKKPLIRVARPKRPKPV